MSDEKHSWIIEMRGRLRTPAPQRLPHNDARQAAVLVPLYVDTNELWTLLTKRSEQLPHHKGQMAFPGGGLEEGESVWEGAMREAHEEIGLDPQKVLQIGELDELAGMASGFRVVPCVAAVPYPVETEINEDEIDEIVPVPLRAFSDSRLIEDRAVLIDGVERMMRVYHIGGRQVWGMTARIVQTLLQRMGLAA
ncbi:MAG: CoA pyrophosphatase [Acidobacteriota bacterium]